ncbi:DnaJ domain-containing protein [Zopfochytrium polystomum]|nr:DnaJ domain-containing protein [Zopfochytrium polystomum]
MPEQDPQEVIASVLYHDNLYARLGISRTATSNDIRRAYLRRSLLCHPDRCLHPQANEAFQRLSNAYQTLKSDSTRQNYDLYGRQVDGNDQSFSDTVAQVFDEFLNGQFDTLLRMLEMVQTLNPDVRINKDQARRVFSSMRDFFLWGGDCWGAAKFELIRLWELQHELSQLSYFDVAGRWRLAGRLSNGVLHLMGTLAGLSSTRGPTSTNEHDASTSST